MDSFFRMRFLELLILVALTTGEGVYGTKETLGLEAGGFDGLTAEPVEGFESDEFPVQILLEILGDDLHPLKPPGTHHIDIELRSFDPAEGFIEIFSNGRLLRRVLDPPPTQVFSVYVAGNSCLEPAEICTGYYTVKAFSFSTQQALAEATVEYKLLPSPAPQPSSPPPSSPSGPSLSPGEARSLWPLPCEAVQFPGFPPFESHLKRPIIVLAYPPHDLGWMHFDPNETLFPGDVSVTWLMSLSCPEAADVLIFSCGYGHGKLGPGAPKVRRMGHQLFLHLCMESTGGIEDPRFRGAMDLIATYQRTSDVPLYYAPGNLSLYQLAPKVEKSGLAMFVISHCGLERDVYLRQVMRFMAVDSYGKCLNTVKLPEETAYEADESNPVSPLVPVMAKYKFVFAFENSIQDDYITEKFYIPLMAGSVPVYKGAPNAADFAPENSFINVHDFEGPEDLAQYLLAISTNAEAYAALHSWRSQPWTPSFLEVAKRAINQGFIYNEGAVHGTAQRVSPSRVSSAIVEKYRRLLSEGSEGLKDSAVQRAVEGAENCGEAECCEAFRVEVLQPVPGQEVQSQLLEGLSVALKAQKVEGFGEVCSGGGSCKQERHKDQPAVVLRVAVLVNGAVRGSAELWTSGAEGVAVLEGLSPSSLQPLSISAAVLCLNASLGPLSPSSTVILRGMGDVKHYDTEEQPQLSEQGVERKSSEPGRLDTQGLSRYLDGNRLAQQGCYPKDPGLAGSVVVVNLDRRPDRWKYMVSNLGDLGLNTYTRIPAADGSTLDPGSPELQWLFRRNHFRSEAGVIGCALSHLRIWRQIVACTPENSLDWVLVLEDDVEFAANFLVSINERIAKLSEIEPSWDFICVGARQEIGEYVDFDEGYTAEGIMRIRNYRSKLWVPSQFLHRKAYRPNHNL